MDGRGAAGRGVAGRGAAAAGRGTGHAAPDGCQAGHGVPAFPAEAKADGGGDGGRGRG
jgi:hypothetical protein